MKGRLIPMTVAHYVEASAHMRHAWLDAAAVGRRYVETGEAWALLLDDDLACVGGVVTPWPGLGEAWALPTPLGRAHGVVMSRYVYRELAAIVHRHSLRRVQADVPEPFNAGHRWLCWMGFQPESRMPLCGPGGEAFVRYRVLRPEPA